MKIKHRALALILTAMMVLTYMPALAFAEEKESADENAYETSDNQENGSEDKHISSLQPEHTGKGLAVGHNGL